MPQKNKHKVTENKQGSIHKYFLRQKGHRTVETLPPCSSVKKNKMAAPTAACKASDKAGKNESDSSTNTQPTNKEATKLSLFSDEFTQLKELILGVENKLGEKITKFEERVELKMADIESTLQEVRSKSLEIESRVDTKLASQEEKIKDSNKEMKEFKTDIQTTIEFLTNKIEDQAKNPVDLSNSDVIKKLNDRIDELEQVNRYHEYRSRQYNLLFYGIPEPVTENNEMSEKRIRDFFISELQMEPDSVKNIIIQNVHRVPRNPTNTYKAGMPNPIIVKFGCIQQRNLVLSRGKMIDKDKHMAIRTDLPAAMKKKRATLAQLAYQLRKNNNLKTAIRETRDDVWLETRDSKEKSWEKYTPPT